jgi:hypothetical protein
MTDLLLMASSQIAESRCACALLGGMGAIPLPMRPSQLEEEHEEETYQMSALFLHD